MVTDDNVSEDSRAVEIVDPSVVEVDGVVNAVEIESVREGARAVVSIDSLNGRVLEGVVTFVESETRTERGVVSFAVTIRADVPDGVRLPVNLSGVSSVIVGERTGAIMVQGMTFLRPQDYILTGLGKAIYIAQSLLGPLFLGLLALAVRQRLKR